MNIEWMAFVTVFLASLGSAAFLVGIYALGIRFLAMTGPQATGEDGALLANGPSRDDEDDDIEGLGRPLWATVAANVCFAVCIIGVLAGIYLIVAK
jgi:hypothetical protein